MEKRTWVFVVVLLVVLSLFFIGNFIPDNQLEYSPINIVLLLALSVLPIGLMGLGIHVILEGMGYRVSAKKLYLIITTSLAANYTTPVKIGIPLRAYLYKKKLGIPLKHGTASLAVEVFINVFIASAIAFIGVSSFFTDYNLKFFSSLFFGLLLLVFVVSALKPKRVNALLEKAPLPQKIKKLGDYSLKLRKGVGDVKKNHMILFSLITFSAYLTVAARLYLITQILGFQPVFLHILFAEYIAYMLGLLSLIPLGLGAKDVGLIVLLTQAGLPMEAAVSAALIQRILGTGTNLLMGTISASILGIKYLD